MPGDGSDASNRSKIIMTHFYRLFTINTFTGKKCGIGVADMIGPRGPWAGLPSEWRRGIEEIPLDPPWPHCKMLRAPLTPADCRQIRYLFEHSPGVELPDVWAWGSFALVSEAAKTVLEAQDDFGHEYIETEVLDTERQQINRKPYYLLNVRRILEIDELRGEIKNRHKMFLPDYHEKKTLPVIQQNPELKAKLAQLPLWRQRKNWSVLYLSQSMLTALQDAGITGLRPYTSYDGEPCEALGRFE